MQFVLEGQNYYSVKKIISWTFFTYITMSSRGVTIVVTYWHGDNHFQILFWILTNISN